MGRGVCECPELNLADTGLFQGLCDRLHGTTGGDYVIKQCDMSPFEGLGYSECMVEILSSCLGVQSVLVRGKADSAAAVAVDRDAECLGGYANHLQCLVETALS